MRTATLPSTDLDVSAICLGTSDIGSKIERRRSFRMLTSFWSWADVHRHGQRLCQLAAGPGKH